MDLLCGKVILALIEEALAYSIIESLLGYPKNILNKVIMKLYNCKLIVQRELQFRFSDSVFMINENYSISKSKTDISPTLQDCSYKEPRSLIQYAIIRILTIYKQMKLDSLINFVTQQTSSKIYVNKKMIMNEIL